MDEIIEKINAILRYQSIFRWQNIFNYKDGKSSFEYHVKHHPIDEKETGKWNSLINYLNYDTISNSYLKTSIDLAQKFTSILNDNYDIQYIEKHESINIVDLGNGLIVCLKYNKYKLCFDIATCFFPSKLNKLLSIRNIIFGINREKAKEMNIDELNYTLCIENNKKIESDYNDFVEAIEDYFGNNSVEYNLFFNNQTQNIDEIVNNIVGDVLNYLELMKDLINNEDDKKYYFVFNDGIEYIAKTALLYKIKEPRYELLYNKFLEIDLNNSYKEALDKCKEYIDEGERKYGNNN